MNSICDLPYFELEIDKSGNAVKPFCPDGLPLSRDLFVISHGWNSNMNDARDLYTNFFTQVSRTLGRFRPPWISAPQCAVMGILWPSEKFVDRALIPGGAAGIVSKTEDLLRNSTYRLMKNRAGIVGRGAVASTLGLIQNAFPGVRIHLAGHSFGCRVITAAAGALLKPVASMTLLQAAFSHNAFSPDYDSTHQPGGFRDVVSGRKCAGPMLVTHSVADQANGFGYPIASRIFRQNASRLGDAEDTFGALGRNGAQHTPEASFGELLPEGVGYSFSPGRIFNLRADDVIRAHGDIVKPETAWALISAAEFGPGNDTIVRSDQR
jgi:pimeloyl-ACP methyl ester carboxylesterase